MAEEIQRPYEHEDLFGAHLLKQKNFVSEKPSRLCLVNFEAFGQDLENCFKKAEIRWLAL